MKRSDGFKLIRELAEQGNARAQFFLGDAYHNMNGATNEAEALKWLKLAAEQDHSIAKLMLRHL